MKDPWIKEPKAQNSKTLSDLYCSNNNEPFKKV